MTDQDNPMTATEVLRLREEYRGPAERAHAIIGIPDPFVDRVIEILKAHGLLPPSELERAFTEQPATDIVNDALPDIGDE